MYPVVHKRLQNGILVHKKYYAICSLSLQLWDDMCGPYVNQISNKLPNEIITPYDLLKTPSEGVTLFGLKHNIKVAILFLYNWLNGIGHFALENCVEDSATAEISRSQIWQWIRHKVLI